MISLSKWMQISRSWSERQEMMRILSFAYATSDFVGEFALPAIATTSGIDAHERLGNLM